MEMNFFAVHGEVILLLVRQQQIFLPMVHLMLVCIWYKADSDKWRLTTLKPYFPENRFQAKSMFVKVLKKNEVRNDRSMTYKGCVKA